MIFSSSNTLLALVHLPGLEEDWTAASSSSIGIAARATPVDIPMFVPTTVLQDRAVKEDLTSLVACVFSILLHNRYIVLREAWSDSFPNCTPCSQLQGVGESLRWAPM